jgi:hypothetical protein
MMMVDDRQAQVPAWRTPRVLSLAVAAVLVMGLALVMLTHERARAHDRQRLRDVRRLSVVVLEYAHEHGRLPHALTELHRPLPHDPASGRSYVYERLDRSDFRLCATLADVDTGASTAALMTGPADRGSAAGWQPDHGRQCLVRALPAHG